MSLGKGGISHRRGMRSSKEGTVFLMGGNRMYSCCLVAGANRYIDMSKDGGNC